MDKCVNEMQESLNVKSPKLIYTKNGMTIKAAGVIVDDNGIISTAYSEDDEIALPDIVTFQDDEFIILDAKYYNLKFTQEILDGQPGLESISKQYLYELAFRDFIEDHEFKGVKNAFLFPTYEDEIENKGRVKLEILSDLGLEDIQVIMLPADKINRMYLENNSIFFVISNLENILL